MSISRIYDSTVDTFAFTLNRTRNNKNINLTLTPSTGPQCNIMQLSIEVQFVPETIEPFQFQENQQGIHDEDIAAALYNNAVDQYRQRVDEAKQKAYDKTLAQKFQNHVAQFKRVSESKDLSNNTNANFSEYAGCFIARLEWPQFQHFLKKPSLQILIELILDLDLPVTTRIELMDIINEVNESVPLKDRFSALIEQKNINECTRIIETGYYGCPAHSWFILGEILKKANLSDDALYAYLKTATSIGRNNWGYSDKRYEKQAGLRSIIVDLLEQAKKIDIELLKKYVNSIIQNDIFIGFEVAKILEAKGFKQAALDLYELYQIDEFSYTKYRRIKTISLGLGIKDISETRYQPAWVWLHKCLNHKLTESDQAATQAILDAFLIKHKLTQDQLAQLCFGNLDVYINTNENQHVRGWDELVRSFDHLIDPKIGFELFHDAHFQCAVLLSQPPEEKEGNNGLDAPEISATRMREALTYAKTSDHLDYFNIILANLVKSQNLSVGDVTFVKPLKKMPNNVDDFILGVETMAAEVKKLQTELERLRKSNVLNPNRFSFSQIATSVENNNVDRPENKFN